MSGTHGDAHMRWKSHRTDTPDDDTKPLSRGTVYEAREGARGESATRETNRQEDDSSGGDSTREREEDADCSTAKVDTR
jgi:hypothetical protein